MVRRSRPARTAGWARTLLVSTALGLAAGPALGQSQGQPSTIGSVRVEGQADSGFTIQPPADKGYAATRATTATRTDTALVDVPQSVTVVTRQQIQDQDIRSIGEALRYVPGAGIAQGEGNRDTPILRGTASTADLFVDGIRDDVQYFRDLYNVERVEVLKGPNAMIFGRGGSGGVINRVTKQANFRTVREITLQGGSDENARGSIDLGQALTDAFSARLVAFYEDSESYRDEFQLERWAVNPTVAAKLGEGTLVQFGYEHAEDERTADRGVPSFLGKPLDVDPSTFFGDPDLSVSDSTVDAVTAALEHQFGNGLVLRNRFRFADHDKFYQNVFPGAVNAAGTTVSLAAYNQATRRETLFNQTDLTYYAATGSINHTLLAGMELGRQETDNLRNTGYFNNTATSLTVPLGNPRNTAPVTFRQSATDADNHGVAKQAAFYVQDQVELTPRFQVILGLRYDRFEADLRNNRTGAEFGSEDDLWSPRAGLVFKPMDTLSLYGSYSLSYLPRAGEQLASLSASNQALDPEEFENFELGAKWEVLPELLATAAVYQLDRGNVAITDPNDPTRSLLVDGQRVRGVELGASGQVTDQWSVIASYAYQDGELTATASATARDGATLAQLPKHSAALWNRYDVTEMWGAGLGVIHQGKRYTSTDNLVSLPSYTRFDAALYFTLDETLRVQVNVENLFDLDYALNAHSNNNITPGSPRAVRVSVQARF